MTDTELIRQLKEQNKLLHAECKAAAQLNEALMDWLNEPYMGLPNTKTYTRALEAWQLARTARIATEPPF